MPSTRSIHLTCSTRNSAFRFFPRENSKVNVVTALCVRLELGGMDSLPLETFEYKGRQVCFSAVERAGACFWWYQIYGGTTRVGLSHVEEES